MVALFTWCYVIISDRFTLALVDHVLATELADISSYYGLTQASSEDTSPAFQSTLAESPSGFWVAVTGYGTLDEKIVGCVGLDFDKQTESGIVRRMSVDETARKLGIGRKLLDTLFAHASSHNVPRITLETSQFQPAAITFYSRYGFTKDRTEYIPILSLWGGLLPIYGFEMYYYSKLLTKPTKA
ncbi:acyl-CoA N-acyltransferase [Flagelloscypha sp. PMI_526]|nr:acyl-CoA N-acyltransferase [Flagelloscypha sp. PMI_526]